jgi:EpsD family peptidyl-prolyl cis-trans isomerase
MKRTRCCWRASWAWLSWDCGGAIARSLLALCCVAATGCGTSEGGTPPSKIAAQVNSEAISEHEVEAALKRGESLERLIEQRLARQRALEQGLDRAPQIVQATESARSEILARAYKQFVAEAQPRPTPQEIARYYAEHPELFAQRRIYSLEEIALARGRDIAAALQDRAAKGEPLESIARWLEALELRFTISRSTRSAEQIALEVLPRLQAMKEGEVHVVNDGAQGLVLFRLLAARVAPMDEAAAAPLIEKFLLARRSSEAVAGEMKRLRQEARIEIFGGRK